MPIYSIEGLMSEGMTHQKEVRMLASKKFSFDAAHFLPTYIGKCKDLHGHHWVVEVAVEGPVDSKTGMVIDFAMLKGALQPIQSLFDHHLLNDILDNPTAENLAAYIYQASQGSLQQACEYLARQPVIAWVRVWETDNSMVEYRRKGQANATIFQEELHSRGG